ncbi:MAG: transporter substrate-binding domain-containing protein, partial [Lachnospiraceae bacterium]|nr:transporter substrate-binding domain-containing protein [Lachnospiraceae bacterium]
MKNIKRIAALGLAAVCVLGTLTGCGKKESASDEASRTKLIVGFDAEYPPYGYMDENGEYVGFDLDLADEVCKRNGWELV